PDKQYAPLRVTTCQSIRHLQSQHVVFLRLDRTDHAGNFFDTSRKKTCAILIVSRNTRINSSHIQPLPDNMNPINLHVKQPTRKSCTGIRVRNNCIRKLPCGPETNPLVEIQLIIVIALRVDDSSPCTDPCKSGIEITIKQKAMNDVCAKFTYEPS